MREFTRQWRLAVAVIFVVYTGVLAVVWLYLRWQQVAPVAAWGRRHLRAHWRALLGSAGAVALTAGLADVLWKFDPVHYPATQAAQFRATATALHDPSLVVLERDLLQYQTDSQIKIWLGFAQAATAGGAVIIGIIAWRNLRETQKKLAVDRESQVTNRFTQAIGQLGAELKDGRPNLEVRLGAIYALERIAKDSPRDHWTIMEVLTAYVRENAPWPPRMLPTAAAEQPPVALRTKARRVPRRRRTTHPAALITPSTSEAPPPKPRTDIQAVLFVLGRRMLPKDFPEPGGLNLSGADLRGGVFLRAYLTGANFTGAQLEKANFRGAQLARASFASALLQGASFAGAQLARASFASALLQGASFVDARLEGVYFADAHLGGASFTGAGLVEANFLRAYLTGANFTGAQLERASFTGAHKDGNTERGLAVERARQGGVMPTAEQVPTLPLKAAMPLTQPPAPFPP